MKGLLSATFLWKEQIHSYPSSSLSGATKIFSCGKPEKIRYSLSKRHHSPLWMTRCWWLVDYLYGIISVVCLGFLFFLFLNGFLTLGFVWAYQPHAFCPLRSVVWRKRFLSPDFMYPSSKVCALLRHHVVFLQSVERGRIFRSGFIWAILDEKNPILKMHIYFLKLQRHHWAIISDCASMFVRMNPTQDGLTDAGYFVLPGDANLFTSGVWHCTLSTLLFWDIF